MVPALLWSLGHCLYIPRGMSAGYRHTHGSSLTHTPSSLSSSLSRNRMCFGVCYTEKAEQAQQHPGSKTTINPAEDNRKKQCRPDETKPNSNATHHRDRKRHNNPTHSYTPSFCVCHALCYTEKAPNAWRRRRGTPKTGNTYHLPNPPSTGTTHRPSTRHNLIHALCR